MTLLGISPRARRSMASITSLSAMSSGSISDASGSVPLPEKVDRRCEAFVVVVVGADDLELEDDHAVLVEARRIEPGAHNDQGPGVVQLPERSLGCAGVARALEGDSERLRHRQGHGWLLERVGRHHPGRPDVECLLPTHRRWLAHRDVGDPLGAQHRDDQEPDRSGTGDEHPILRVDVGQAERVQRDGRRLGQRGRPGRQGVGNPDEAVGGHRLVLAERSPVARRSPPWRAAGTPTDGPAGRAGTCRTPRPRSPPPGHPGTSRSRSARRPRCPTTRGREWRPVGRSAPAPYGGRSRRSRMPRSRRGPRRAPAPVAAPRRTRSCRRPRRRPPASVQGTWRHTKGLCRRLP